MVRSFWSWWWRQRRGDGSGQALRRSQGVCSRGCSNKVSRFTVSLYPLSPSAAAAAPSLSPRSSSLSSQLLTWRSEMILSIWPGVKLLWHAACCCCVWRWWSFKLLLMLQTLLPGRKNMWLKHLTWHDEYQSGEPGPFTHLPACQRTSQITNTAGLFFNRNVSLFTH